MSEDDDAYEKFPFYSALKVKEILIIEPKTCHPELYQLKDGQYELAPEPMTSVVTGLLFEKAPNGLLVRDPATKRQWIVPG